MNQETRTEVAAKTHGLLHIRDKTYAVRVPGAAEWSALAGELRRLAKRKARSPLAALAEEFDNLPAAMRGLAMEKAIGLKSGGEVEPTTEQIGSQIWEPEGCRAWVWILIRREHPDVTFAEIEGLIDASNVVDVLAELATATGQGQAFPNSNGQTS